MTINARSEDDVDEATILEKVSKASGNKIQQHDSFLARKVNLILLTGTFLSSVSLRLIIMAAMSTMKLVLFW